MRWCVSTFHFFLLLNRISLRHVLFLHSLVDTQIISIMLAILLHLFYFMNLFLFHMHWHFVYMHVSVRVPEALKLELQTAMWLMGVEATSSGRAASALGH